LEEPVPPMMPIVSPEADLQIDIAFSTFLSALVL
jgi:hypothetical protein